MPNDPVAAALAWRMPHETCADCWYSCPMSGECCDESKPTDKCECWAKIVNEYLDTLAAEVRRLQEESRCAECEHDAFLLVAEDLKQAETALAALRETVWCSQCGQYLWQRACGPSHAARWARREP